MMNVSVYVYIYILKTMNIYNKHNTTWKVLCRVFTHSLFFYQKSYSFSALTRWNQ